MEHKNMQSNMSKNLSYLLIGGGIGATLALLFAPKSGSEMREDISLAATNGMEKTKETVGKLRENANTYYETAKDKANTIYNTVTHKAEDVVNEVKALPDTAESLISNKIEQIDSAVEEGKKEYKRQAQKV
jgi:gas vesicle protein